MILIDSDILIDYLRLHVPAVSLLDGLKPESRNIAFISQLELYQGCGTKIQAARVGRFLGAFQALPLTPAICKKALNLYREHRWKSSLDLPDVLIAATAIEHGLTLLTRNLKHYQHLPNMELKKPY